MIDFRYIVESLPKAKASCEELFIAKGGYVIERSWGGLIRQIKNAWQLQR